jgi:uncharacterized protein
MTMTSVTAPQSRAETPGPVASWKHLAGFLLIQAGSLALGIAAQARTTGGPGVISDHRSGVQLYLSLIVAEWAMFYYVWVGLHKRGFSLSEITGGRWRTAKDVLRDAAIALPFWVIWEGTARLLHVVMGESHAKTLDSLLPQNGLETVLWIVVSISAGICEELAFRGYLQRQIRSLSGSVALAVLGQGLVFGTAHAYQGWKNVVIIAALGVLYGALAAWRKNLAPGMLAHAWSDIYACLKFV